LRGFFFDYKDKGVIIRDMMERERRERENQPFSDASLGWLVTEREKKKEGGKK